MTNFARPGNPGAKFKNVLEKMIKCLSLPKAARDELGIGEDGMMPPAEMGSEEKQKSEESDDEDVEKRAERL